MITTKIYANSLSDALSGITNMSEASTVGSFTDSVLSIAIPLAVFSVVVLLAFSAYQLMTSKGDPDKLKQAKEVITNAVIGFLFILMSVAILIFLGKLFGVDITSGR
ncbi:MAG: hypothetical protein ACOX0X_01840 [Candidatus Dojkabacteria bacterium]